MDNFFIINNFINKDEENLKKDFNSKFSSLINMLEENIK